ncbi:MAG: SDR family oxidoreductase [Candidatus Thiodiazotropha sp. (ex Ctena orbiculata)]|nr:SDR family oxidoreductase [Candidatus Thiodiazotropha taylori]
MQDLESLRGHVIEMDVTDEDQVTVAVDRVIAEQCQIDVLVNNADYSAYGAVDDVLISFRRVEWQTIFERIGIKRLFDTKNCHARPFIEP